MIIDLLNLLHCDQLHKLDPPQLQKKQHRLQPTRLKRVRIIFLFLLFTVETSVAAPPQPVEGIEIDKVAEYNGQSLFNLDLESLEDKPWRKPGSAAQP